VFRDTRYTPDTGAWGLGTVSGYPCAGDVSSLFGAIDMAEHAAGHNGTDIAAASGTPICAPCDMVITDVFSLDVQSTVPLFAQIKEWFGNSVWGIFTGPDGNQYRTMFAHMESSPVVREEQSVSAGTILGYVGSTGLSTGPHLHWTVGPASNRWLARGAGNFEALNWAASGDAPEVQVTQQPNYDVNALTDALNKVQAAINDLRVKIDGMR
jgi:murein DD-endopeptidase MepM/ murein hydrolase activator NlpD